MFNLPYRKYILRIGITEYSSLYFLLFMMQSYFFTSLHFGVNLCIRFFTKKSYRLCSP